MAALASEVVSSIVGLEPSGIASTVFSLFSRIHEQYGQMQDNQLVCQDLKKEIDIISSIVSQLSERNQLDLCERIAQSLDLISRKAFTPFIMKIAKL